MSTYRSHYSTAPRRVFSKSFLLAVAVLVALGLTLWSLQ